LEWPVWKQPGLDLPQLAVDLRQPRVKVWGRSAWVRHRLSRAYREVQRLPPPLAVA
jgi:hypothetical protein